MAEGLLGDEQAVLIEAVYSREPYEVDGGEGDTTTVAPPAMFGLLAGA